MRPVLALLALLVLPACSAGVAEGGTSAAGLPVVPASAGHLHGMGVNPADGLLHLGTHSGTMVVEPDGVRRVGSAQTDLMGFTVAGPDHFYSSGHPGPGDDLPEPVGLLESTDGGKSWSVLSRAGESDFHVVAAADGAVYAFDGALVTSSDGRSWSAAADLAPASLAVHPEQPRTVVGTTQSGPVVSTDGAGSFTPLADAPLLYLLSWPAAEALWAVDPEGGVHVSADAGATWEARGTVPGVPQAFTASDADTVWVATAEEVVRSTDGGRTFERVAERA